MSKSSWIGAAAGLWIGGPIGALIGYYVGKNVSFGKMNQQKAFEISLLILSSMVINADGKVLKSELEYVKKFFINTFGVKKANEYFRIFNKLNKEDLNSKMRQICLQLNANVNHSSRLEILHFLFGLAAADNNIHQSEINLIKKIATYMNINSYDFQSIHAMFTKKGDGNNLDKWYSILEIQKGATDDQVKKAYRKMAIKYHPDKIQGVSDDIKKLAEEKFLLVKEAYDQIMKSR